MAPKLTARQQSQLSFLQTLPPKFSRIKAIIEQMAGMQADETAVRQLARMLDEMKSGGQALGIGPIAETAGLMSTMSRRGGGHQMKVRGLRELFGSLQINYEGALRAATTPERNEE